MNENETSYQAALGELLRLYNEAYHEYVHCKDSDEKEAKRKLEEARSKFFNY